MTPFRLFMGTLALVVVGLTIYWMPGGSDWMRSAFTGFHATSTQASPMAGVEFSGGVGSQRTAEPHRLVDVDSPKSLADRLLHPNGESSQDNVSPVQFASMTQVNPQDNQQRRITQDGGLRVPSATEAPQSTAGILVVEDGQLVFKDDIEIAAQADGILIEMYADEGSFVRRGEGLVDIDDRLAQSEVMVARKELEAAKFKASDESQIHYAKAAVNVARVDVEKSKQLVKDGAESDMELRKKQLELIKAEAQVLMATTDKERDKAAVGVAEAKLKAAEVQILLRKIPAPFDGTVSEITKQRYAWVRAGEPIMKFSSMENLRASGVAHVTDTPHLMLGLPAKVSITLAPGKVETVTGVVGFVAPKSNNGTGYKILVDIPNKVAGGHYVFRAGMSVRIEIDTSSLHR